MVTQADVLELIFSVFGEMSTADGPRLAPDPGTILVGRESPLDSLAMVDLIIRIEERLHADFGIAMSLADSDLMNAPDSPYRTAGSLASHIVSLAERQQAG